MENSYRGLNEGPAFPPHPVARTAPHEGVRGTLTFMDLLTRPIPDAPAGGVVDGSRDVPILLEHTKVTGHKKGPYSKVEDQQLKTAIEQYRNEYKLSDSDIEHLILKSRQMKGYNTFWPTIVTAMPSRDFKSLNARVRRLYNPLSRQGQWTEDEDTKLLAGVASHGTSWEKIGRLVGRTGHDCKDRYRNHLSCQEGHAVGKWSLEEETRLVQVVDEVLANCQGTTSHPDIWAQVQHKLGNLRTRQQCRDKWVHSLSKRIQNEGKAPHWSDADSGILVHRVGSLPQLQDQAEIIWANLLTWGFWNSRDLRRRWNDLQESIEGYEDKTHQEIVDALRVRYPCNNREVVVNQLNPHPLTEPCAAEMGA